MEGVTPEYARCVPSALHITLIRRLRRKRTLAELYLSPGQITEPEVDRKRGAQRIEPSRRVLQRIVILQEVESKAVRVVASSQIHANRMRWRRIVILIDGVIVSEIVLGSVKVVGEPIER